MSTLTNLFISDTYKGLLHASGAALPGGRSLIYDGEGTETAISIGKINEGVTISGGLTVGALAYPEAQVLNGAVVVQTSTTSLGLVTSLPGSILADITAAAGGTTYNNINSITITSEGLVSKVTESVPTDAFTIQTTEYSKDNSVKLIREFPMVDNEWTEILLPSFFSDAKAGIFFIEPKDAAQHLAADFAFNNIIVSPNSSNNAYKVLTVIGLDAPSDIKYSASAQFSCPIGTDSGNKVIYFKRTGVVSTNTLIYRLYYIAKQY